MNRRGFTLMEVLVATAVAGLVFDKGAAVRGVRQVRLWRRRRVKQPDLREDQRDTCRRVGRDVRVHRRTESCLRLFRRMVGDTEAGDAAAAGSVYGVVREVVPRQGGQRIRE